MGGEVMLTIRHSHEEGTLLEGSCKGDGVYEIVKRHGFAYFPSIRAIGIRQSRDQIAKRYQINAAAEALRAAGHEVTIDIDDTPRDRGTVLADQGERLDERADRLAARSARHASAADAHLDRANGIAERWAGGQHIILGHHSTRKALRDREKMHAAHERSLEEQRVADAVAYQASRVGKLDCLRLYRCTLEEFGTNRDPGDEVEPFGAVVMNPPFSSPGYPVLWAEHVLRAYDWLAAGGRLVAIVPVSFEYRTDRKTRQVRELADELGGYERLPAGSFKNAGADVRTILIWLDRPRAAVADLEPATPSASPCGGLAAVPVSDPPLSV